MENKQAKVINESGTTRLNKEASAAKEARENGNFRGRRRDNRRNRRAADEVKKEFDSVNISINRVSRTVKCCNTTNHMNAARTCKIMEA